MNIYAAQAAVAFVMNKGYPEWTMVCRHHTFSFVFNDDSHAVELRDYLVEKEFGAVIPVHSPRVVV